MTDILTEELYVIPMLTHERNGGSPMPSTGHTRTHYTTRVEAVATEQPRPLSTIDYPAHVWELAGQSSYPIGLPVNIARRQDRWRQRIEDALNFALVFVGIVGVLALWIWIARLLISAVAVP